MDTFSVKNYNQKNHNHNSSCSYKEQIKNDLYLPSYQNPAQKKFQYSLKINTDRSKKKVRYCLGILTIKESVCIY